MVACAILRPLTYVPLVLLRSVTMKRPSRKRSRACFLETLPFGSMRSLPCTRPTLISCLSKSSLRSAPPFSLMTIANMVGRIQLVRGEQDDSLAHEGIHPHSTGLSTPARVGEVQTPARDGDSTRLGS